MIPRLSPQWLSVLPSFARKRIEGQTDLQKIIENTGWLFIDKILRMGIGVVVGVWIARYLGPDQFGSFNFALSFVALFGTFASLGLDGIVIRELVREPHRKNEILSSTFLLKLTGGCIAFLVSVLAIFILRPSESQTLWLVGIIAAGMIFQSFDVIDLWFQSKVRSKYTVIVKNIAFVVFTLVKIYLIITKAKLIAFALSVLAETILGAVGLALFYWKQKTLGDIWTPRIATARRLLFDSWPLMLSSLAIMVYVKIDQVMLGVMVGNSSVGIYSSAVKISEVWYFVPMAIISSFGPSIMLLKQQNENSYYNKLQNIFNMMALLAFIVALPISFLSNFIITNLYGASYKDASIILTIHVWAGLFVFQGVARSLWILAEGFTKISLYTTISGAVLNIVLNLFLIPRHGALGAAIATVVSYCFSDYIIFLIVPGFRKIGYMMTKSLMLRFLWKRRVGV